MLPILERIEQGEILVSDGAVGTFLQEQGLAPGACPELLNIDRPDMLQEFTRQYVKAGSDIVQTNTFGASLLKLSDYGLDDKIDALNRSAVELAKEAAGNSVYIAGSVGPSGKLLKPYGDIEPEIMQESFKRQIQILIDNDVDLILIETMTDLKEAVLAVVAARSISVNFPVAVTLTFDVTPQGNFTIMGDRVKNVCESLTEAGADIVGSNCGTGIENMLVLAREFADQSSVPFMIQANAGKPEIENGSIIYPESAEFFGQFIPELVKLGVSIIGGCCGTTPDHIRAIKGAIIS